MENPQLVRRLDAAATAGRLIVFDAAPGFGSRTAIRAWLAHHADWQVAWDDARMPPDGPDEVVRRGLRVLDHLAEAPDPSGRTVLVIEHSPRLVDHIDLLDLAGLSERRPDVTVVVCTGGRLAHRPPQRDDVEVVTDDDLAWDLERATIALARRGLNMNEEQLARLLVLCNGSPGRIVACAQLRTEYPGASADRMYARWLHERLTRHGADRLLLTLDALGEVPLELVPSLLALAGSGEEALAELVAEHLVAPRESPFADAPVLAVVAPRSGITILRSLVPTRGAGVTAADVARAMAPQVAPDSLHALYWAALGGDAAATCRFVEFVLAHPDPRIVEFSVDTRSLVAGRVVNPELIAACVLLECGRGGDPRDVPDADNLLRLSLDELDARCTGVPGAVSAARAVLLVAVGRAAEAVQEAESTLELLERTPWGDRAGSTRVRDIVHVTLLAAFAELLDFQEAERHARAVVSTPGTYTWSGTLEAAAGIALYVATLRGDARMAEEVEPLTRVREVDGTRPARTVLLARYVDAMNARDVPRMTELADALRGGEVNASAWSMLCSFAVKDAAFRERTPDSLAESMRDRHDLAPLPRAVALDLRARQLIEMGRPGLALRLLDGIDSDPRHVFCFPALRARALLALGFPQAALRELEGCGTVEGHSLRAGWRLRIARIVGLARSGMPSVARAAFETLVEDVPARWWGGVINWARFPELAELAERAGVVGPESSAGDDVFSEQLTPRELELLELLREPTPLQQIATEQYVSLNTLKTHLRNLYRKLGVGSRAEAADRAMRAGLFEVMRAISR
ncbi:MAG: LuxR C-terminal-related transcriptional regulator [Protaetiibacter sp.]